MTFIKYKDDEILSKDEVIKNRWKGYFCTPLNTRNYRKQLPVMKLTQGSPESITEAEVKIQLEKMSLQIKLEDQMIYQ